MRLCTALIARWRRFLGRLPPTHAALFQLLLLALLAANVVGIVLTLRRLQHSYAFPTSVLSVKRLDSPPAFSVLSVPSYANMSLSCVDMGHGNAPCPEASWTSSEGWQLIAGTMTDKPFTPGDVAFATWLHAEGARPGDCFDMQALGVPLESITPATLVSTQDFAPPASWFHFCPQFAPGHFFYQSAELSFSALEDVHGRVNFSISVSVSSGRNVAGDAAPTLVVQIDTTGGVRIPWETQQYNYTLMDALTSVFAYANMSFAVIAFLFPWRYVERGRMFKLACDKDGHDDEAADEGADLEPFSSHAQQLQERMLPDAAQTSSSPLDFRSSPFLDPEFERVLRGALADFDRRRAMQAAAAGASQA